jgi:adenine-specific DNA-methyltransferase
MDLGSDATRQLGALVLPEKKQSFYNRLGRLRRLVRGSDRLAQALVQKTLHLLAVKRFPLLARRLVYQHQQFNNSKDVEQLAEWLRPMDVLHLAFWLSSLYANLLSKKRRKHHALFFTPPELSSRVIANLRRAGANFSTARFIDPGCGGAAFLAPLAGVIRDALRDKGTSPKRTLKHLETHLTGWDIDPLLCKLCKAFVWMVMYEEIKATQFIPELQVRRGDALTISRRKKSRFDVVVCNPPYRKVPTKELANLSQENRAICSGQPNLYAIFMAVAVRLTKRGGQIGLITPTSFLSGPSFRPLRKRLAADTEIRQVDLVEKRQGVFVSVEQETAVTILQKVARNAKRKETSVFAIGSEQPSELVGTASVPKDGSVWVLPRAKGDVPLLAVLRARKHTLASYGYETRAGLFVPHRDKRRTRKERRGQARAFPLIWCTDIGQDGRFEFDLTQHSKHFVVMRKKDDGVVLRKPSVALQRTTAKDDSRRLVAAPISENVVKKYGGYVGENHVVFLLQGERAVCDVNLLAKILRSKTVDRLFRCISGSVSVSSSELAELSLPDLQIVHAAVARGESIESAIDEGYGLKRKASVKAPAQRVAVREEAVA